VYEYHRLGLSFAKIAEHLSRAHPKSDGTGHTWQAAQNLYNSAREVKKRKGASVQTRRPLAREPRDN
jgi:hypothetical protein